MSLSPAELQALAEARTALGHPAVPYPGDAHAVPSPAPVREAFEAHGLSTLCMMHPAVGTRLGLLADYGRYSVRSHTLPAAGLAWLRTNPVPGWDIRVVRRGGCWYVSVLPLTLCPAAAP